jgi:hypothetical protein
MGNARSEGDSKAYLAGVSPRNHEVLHVPEERQHTMRHTGESHARSTSVHPGMCEARCPASQRGQASMEHTHLSSDSSPKRVSCRNDDSASKHKHLKPYDKSRSLSTIQIKDIYDSDQMETSYMPRFRAVVSPNSTRFRDSHSAQVALGLMMIDSTRAAAEIVRLGPLRP